MSTAKRGQCPVCRFRFRLRADGTLQEHHLYSGHDRNEEACPGTGQPALMGSPERIVVAGDWHGNTEQALHVIRMAAKHLGETEPAPYILHCGDFGIWPGGERYLRDVRRALADAGVWLLFIDGNHEDFSQLEDWNHTGFHPGLRDNSEWLHIYWLRRGYRWRWHDREWLALGGGVSLDKAIRTRGKTWWPQEEITDAQEARVISEDHADVMVTHDCPSGVRHTFPPPPSFWALQDLARNDAHRERLQRIVDAVQPSHLMHGHLHRSYQRIRDFGYGPVEVTGLDCDEGDGANWAILDVRTMTWETD